MAGPKPNKINTSTLKSRILNIAQTSVYQIKLQPPGPVQEYLRTSDPDIDYGSQGLDIELLCDSTALPGQSLGTHEQSMDYPGVRELMAHRKIYDDRIDFSFMVDKEYDVIQFFEGWINYVTGQGTTFTNEEYTSRSRYYRMNYPRNYKTDNLYISKFEKDAMGYYLTYQFIGAFPISIISSPISYDTSNILKYSVSFSYMRYIKTRKKKSLIDEDRMSILPIFPKGNPYPRGLVDPDNNPHTRKRQWYRENYVDPTTGRKTGLQFPDDLFSTMPI